MSLTARADELATRYSATLTDLDQKRPESVCAARDLLRALLPQSPPADRASIFRAFVKFNLAVAENGGERFDAAIAPVSEEAFTILGNAHWKSGSASDYLRRNARARRALGPWLECGFGVYVSEGAFYAGLDVASLEQFAPMLPADLRAWLSFLKQEGGFDDIVEDASLRLSWQDLADRLHRWEDFLRAHPSLDDELRPEVHHMACILFFGLDNSSLVDAETNQVYPEVLSAWQRFARDPRPSRYVGTMRKLLAMVEGSGNRLVPESRALTEWVDTEWKQDVRTHDQIAK